MTAMKLRFLSIMTAAATLTASTAFSRDSDRPDYVRVRSISFAGSGCAAGSVTGNIATDFQAFAIFWDSFLAEAGPDVSIRNHRVNCQLSIDLDMPQGWQYTVQSIDQRGYVSLDPRVEALEQTSLYFQGSSATARMSTTFRGPIDRDYQVRDTIGISQLVWSPCGAQRALNVNFELRVSNSGNPGGRGLITLMDSLDGFGKTAFTLQWRRCR